MDLTSNQQAKRANTRNNMFIAMYKATWSHQFSQEWHFLISWKKLEFLKQIHWVSSLPGQPSKQKDKVISP